MELLDFTRKKLESALLGNGFAKFKASQIMQWIYQKRVFSFDEMTNISKSDRVKLGEMFEITPVFPDETFTSSDGTEKLAFTLADGNVVEAVIIPEETRCTLCVSTQAGCPIKCAFCRTGSLGFRRNLTVSEINSQVLASQIESEKSGKRITNLVFMGMGEPLLNFENLLDATDILLDDFGFNFSNRKITVSTSGIADKIVELGERTKVNLAVSLHAVTDEKRDKIMPVNKPAIDELCQKVDCRYTLVVESAKRARELVGGAQPLIDAKEMKPVSVAVDEINRGLLTYDNPAEQEEQN